MNIAELREYQLEFEKIRGEFRKEYKRVNKLRKKFIKDYSIANLTKLTKDEYVIGKGKSTFCNRIENELNNWGNIHGSPATKFGLYFGKYGQDKTRKYRIGRQEFSKDEDIALGLILNAITQLLTNRAELEILKKNPISPMFKGKILSVYYPEEFLNIYSAKHLNYFINTLGIDNNSRSELDKQALLLKYKNNDKVMKPWKVYEFSKFLYNSFGNPNDEIKEADVHNELKAFKLNDFPPIETLKFDYIELKTIELPTTKDRTKSKSKKIDYSKQSKRLKRIGDRGEQIVLRAEKQYLRKNGKNKLAKLVDRISERDDSVGYDILSYDLEGNTRYIEVKSTLKKVGKGNVYISSNELSVANNKSNYYFYIIYEVGSKRPKIWKIKGLHLLNDENVIKEPILFKLNIHIK